MKQISIVVTDNRLTEDNMMPSCATNGAAAVDLRAMTDSNMGATEIPPNQVRHFVCGFKMHIADPNLCAMILPRSGLGAKQGIIVANGTGLIDSDYQGEIIVALRNVSDKSFYLNPMERIAQMVFVPVVQVELTPVDKFIPTERGEGGFGSTGKN